MWYIPEYILCLFFLILVDFFMAKKIAVTDDPRRRKLFLMISIISNFGLLFYFKYVSFFTDNINLLLEPLFHTQLKVHHELLPIGLSFHTFQSVSYIVDVYRRQQEPEKHLGIYSNYVLFFPQMVAGPIERYSTLGTQLRQAIRFHFSFVTAALPLILSGLFYKMVIADNCGLYVNHVYEQLGEQHGMNVLLAVLLFSVQIYADFFGYSLIAQGSAMLFGIRLMDNFRFPFFSVNIIDFWKAWHISLTSWFRQYVYIPLGGNREGRYRHLRNILVIFVLSGLWHGASWNFILWGSLHGVFYLIAVFCSRFFDSRAQTIRVFLTFLIVSLIFVFFRSRTFQEAQLVYSSLFHYQHSFDSHALQLYLFVILCFTGVVEYSVRSYGNYATFYANLSQLPKMLILGIMLFALFTYAGIDNLPFIYFQF